MPTALVLRGMAHAVLGAGESATADFGAAMFISRNTVKSEVVSIYRKLGVSSRSDAIERAVEVGLLDDSIYPRPSNLIPDG